MRWLISLVVIILVSNYSYKKYIKYLEYQQFLQERAQLQKKINQLLLDAGKIPGEFWDEKYKDTPIKDEYKVVYITSAGGEYSVAKHFQYAAEKKGWVVKVYYKTVIGKEDEIINFNPDFIIASPFANDMELDVRIQLYKRYYYLPMPLAFYYKDNNRFDYLNPGGRLDYIMATGHGFLIATEKEIDIYRQICDKMQKPFYGIKLLPLASCNSYDTPADPKKIIWGGASSWDKFRSSDRYKKFILSLTEDVPIKVYGPYHSFKYLKPKVYGGFIEPGLENIEAIRKNGIALLTHSDMHITSADPSLRIFEAAGANVISISDMHPFTMKHFGDSMLYFDQNAPAEEMYKQVKNHVDWIMANPDKAKEMANRAHKIFLEKFTVDKDLIRIAKMHEYILQQEKKMNLDYNLVY